MRTDEGKGVLHCFFEELFWKFKHTTTHTHTHTHTHTVGKEYTEPNKEEGSASWGLPIKMVMGIYTYHSGVR